MKFIAYNHYNNNSGGLGDFESAYVPFLSPEASINITNEGITIFLLRKSMSIEKKLRLLSVLDTKLKEHEGHGIDFVGCASSDCVLHHELEPFYAGAKRINPSIGTLWVGDQERASTVDYIIDPLAI